MQNIRMEHSIIKIQHGLVKLYLHVTCWPIDIGQFQEVISSYMDILLAFHSQREMHIPNK